MPKDQRFSEDDIALKPEYHDARWDHCRYCGCNGDLRWGTCFPCAMGNVAQRLWHRIAVKFKLAKAH